MATQWEKHESILQSVRSGWPLYLHVANNHALVLGHFVPMCDIGLNSFQAQGAPVVHVPSPILTRCWSSNLRWCSWHRVPSSSPGLSICYIDFFNCVLSNKYMIVTMWYYIALTMQGVLEFASVLDAKVFHISQKIKLKRSATRALSQREISRVMTRALSRDLSPNVNTVIVLNLASFCGSATRR